MSLNFNIETEQGKRDFQLFLDACKKMLTGEGYKPQSFNTCGCKDSCPDPCERGCPIAKVMQSKMRSGVVSQLPHLLKDDEMCLFSPTSKECREFACSVCPTYQDCDDVRKWAKVLKDERTN